MAAKLYYFDGRGKGEIVRLALAAAGIEFSEELLTQREQFVKLMNDGKLLFAQVPMLEIDGKCLVQTNAIVRYLGRKAGLTGKNEDEAILIDQYFEGARDLMGPTLGIGFRPEADVLQDCKSKLIPKYFPIFEKVAAANSSGFLVGNGLTLADVSLLEPLLVFVEYFGKEVLKDYPALQKFYEKVTSVDRIKNFLNGPQRKRKNDDRYISEVKKVLAW